MQNSKEDVIDLTQDFYFRARPRVNTDEVIDLVNESFHGDKNKQTDKVKTTKKKSKVKDGTKKTIKKPTEKNTTKFGCCSICWDPLGNKPLASTKCGHVYCRTCLEKSLKCNKRCPTCRCILKGASAYHPLYLELG